MRVPHRQRGLGWLGMLYVFGSIALVAILTIKLMPIYLNEMKIRHTLEAVTQDPEMRGAEAPRLRDAMQRRWDVEDIQVITPRDVAIRRTDEGRFMGYDYEARTLLFYNISIVIHFEGEYPLPGGNG
jgi:hypothetical protein